MKSNKGITLISLIASLLLVIILAAATITTSMNAYNQMKFEGAKAELEEIQKLIDEIAADYQSYLKEKGTTKTYAEYFTDRYNASNFSSKLLSAHKADVKNLMAYSTDVENAANNSSPTAFYFTADDLVKYFDLKGIDSVVVDFSTRTVYSVDGIKDSNDSTKIYYTPADWNSKVVVTTTGAASTTSTITASKVSKSGNTYDIQIILSPKLANDVSEVYIYVDGKYIKADGFRDVTNVKDDEENKLDTRREANDESE